MKSRQSNIVIESNKVVATDTMYGIQTAHVIDVKNGQYHTYLTPNEDTKGEWDSFDGYLSMEIVHSELDLFIEHNWVEYDNSILVDGNTFGLFDYDYFMSNHNLEYAQRGWYHEYVSADTFGICENKCIWSDCENTIHKISVLYTNEEKNEICGIKITYNNEK